LYLAEAERLESERQLLDDAVNLLVIGHNNGLSDWADSLLGRPQPPLRTCQLLVLQSPSQKESSVRWRVELSWIADQKEPW
jgi:phosphohistidine phosphatase SixA